MLVPSLSIGRAIPIPVVVRAERITSCGLCVVGAATAYFTATHGSLSTHLLPRFTLLCGCSMSDSSTSHSSLFKPIESAIFSRAIPCLPLTSATLLSSFAHCLSSLPPLLLLLSVVFPVCVHSGTRTLTALAAAVLMLTSTCWSSMPHSSANSSNSKSQTTDKRVGDSGSRGSNSGRRRRDEEEEEEEETAQ